MKKLASHNITTAIMASGVLIMLIGGILITPPQAKLGTLGAICMATGLIIICWGIIRASSRQHKP